VAQKNWHIFVRLITSTNFQTVFTVRISYKAHKNVPIFGAILMPSMKMAAAANRNRCDSVIYLY